MPDLSSRVSVALLTYNCGQRLQPILDRLETRSVPVIAVDKGSIDQTVELLADRDIEVVARPENIGAAARNVGVHRATTPYVAMCTTTAGTSRPGCPSLRTCWTATPYWPW